MGNVFFTLAASATLLAGCTTAGVAQDAESVAAAFDPLREYPVCGTYGQIDRDQDGRISRAEWLGYGNAAFGSWDTNANGRIGQGEFANCWYAGGFSAVYKRAKWQPAFATLDLNEDGAITSNEFFNAGAWVRLEPAGTDYVDGWPWE